MLFGTGTITIFIISLFKKKETVNISSLILIQHVNFCIAEKKRHNCTIYNQ